MKREYQLIASYVKGKYFISTIYRQASTIVPMWYFETMVWAWDKKTRQSVGNILEMEDSGGSEAIALQKHFEIVQIYSEK